MTHFLMGIAVGLIIAAFFMFVILTGLWDFIRGKW
jgi:hypothetical protein